MQRRRSGDAALWGVLLTGSRVCLFLRTDAVTQQRWRQRQRRREHLNLNLNLILILILILNWTHCYICI